MIKSYRDLDVWNIAMALGKDIYKFTSRLPKEEVYGLTMQLKRAAVSIPSNIAEGHSRQHRKEFIQFLYLSLGSLAELETQLILSHDVYQIETPENIRLRTIELGRKMRRMVQSLQAPSPKSQVPVS